MAKKKKKPKNTPDERGKRPRDPNQLAAWVVQQSTTTARPGENNFTSPLDTHK